MKGSHWLIVLFLTVFGARAMATTDCDVEAGRKQYAKCAACHATESGVHGAGPSLAGILGRIAGSQPGFIFSDAIAKEGIVWDALTLSEFLENPGSYVPGNVMPFSGIRNEDQRQALICYLTTL